MRARVRNVLAQQLWGDRVGPLGGALRQALLQGRPRRSCCLGAGRHLAAAAAAEGGGAAARGAALLQPLPRGLRPPCLAWTVPSSSESQRLWPM